MLAYASDPAAQLKSNRSNKANLSALAPSRSLSRPGRIRLSWRVCMIIETDGRK